MRYYHFCFAIACVLASPASTQEYGELKWLTSPEIAPRDLLCIERAAIELEPTQDGMFDLAQLIVHSICTSEIFAAIHQTGMAEKIDTQKSFDQQVRYAGQAVAAARLSRLNGNQTASHQTPAN